MKIVHIPCLADNYSYLIVDESTKEAAAVDPVEPEKVLSAAAELGVDLKLVITTHHHWDHAGGNNRMKELVPNIKVYGGSVDNVEGCTDKLKNGDKLSFGGSVTILSLHTPCHTKGHISYYVTDKEEEDPAVFTGDTLYTEKNLHFALTVEPNNVKLKEKLLRVEHQRHANLPSIPSSIGEELETNPFMRVNLRETQETVSCHSPIEALRTIRMMKDAWKG